jgi:tetratricopeptide (TPR) repeat protein
MVAQGQNVDGVRLVQQRQYQAALQRFQSALQTDPTNADANYNVGATLHRAAKETNDQNLFAQAGQYYQQALVRNPNHVEAHRGMAVLLVETNRSREAFDLLKNWTTTSPQYAEAKVELARLYEEFGDVNSAQQYLTQAVQQDFTNARALSALGRISERSGNLQQALASYQRAYQLDRNQPHLAERVAALQQQVPGTWATNPNFSGPNPNGGSTMATGPQNRTRF